jgi:hypothetical protein
VHFSQKSIYLLKRPYKKEKWFASFLQKRRRWVFEWLDHAGCPIGPLPESPKRDAGYEY